MFLAGLASAQVPATPPPVTTYISPEALFQAHPLRAWPEPASPAATADLQAVLTAQAQRTRSDTEEALLDASRGPVAWAQDSAGLGAAFTEQRYPATTALLLSLHEDMRAVNRSGNTERGYRVRPAAADARVKSIFAESLTNTASYPSARSASSRVWALLLGDVFPERRTMLMAHADRTAQLRLLGGAHFPTDIRAGQEVGDAYYAQLSGNPLFQHALKKAKEESQASKP